MTKGGAVMQLVFSVVLIGGILYFLFCFFLFLMQGRLLFYPNLPSREIRRTPSDMGLKYEPVILSTRDGVSLSGWYVPAESESEKGTLLFFHGNAGNISHRLDSLLIFNRLGLSTLIIDYRGYGQSGGRVSEQGMYRDADAAWQYLTETRGLEPHEIILFGRSLGGAVAANLASRTKPAGLILESTFTSVPDMAAGLYPVFPVRLLSRFKFNAGKALLDVTSPVMIIHSPNDEIIPFENGRKLFESAGEPKIFLEIRGSHNEGFMVSGSIYLKGLERFILFCRTGEKSSGTEP
jgi:fermentation-respiration switch protein FrsA (DUF1100 family)